MTCPGIPNLKNSMLLEELKRALIKQALDSDWGEDGEGLAEQLLKEYFDIEVENTLVARKINKRLFLNLYYGDELLADDEIYHTNSNEWKKVVLKDGFIIGRKYRRPLR